MGAVALLFAVFLLDSCETKVGCELFLKNLKSLKENTADVTSVNLISLGRGLQQAMKQCKFHDGALRLIQTAVPAAVVAVLASIVILLAIIFTSHMNWTGTGIRLAVIGTVTVICSSLIIKCIKQPRHRVITYVTATGVPAVILIILIISGGLFKHRQRGTEEAIAAMHTCCLVTVDFSTCFVSDDD
ncbi:hypothetical protein D9C73_014301 [Collichthys lucidus]|uniref:Uncharacterized protein n=1 Tax=Collichthys lucidus TaxID=240159 RepID=A0A4U5UWI8_COLLU|nr:hypothetical protein D9C73_014301 [Collichthys lucidus]